MENCDSVGVCVGVVVGFEDGFGAGEVGLGVGVVESSIGCFGFSVGEV